MLILSHGIPPPGAVKQASGG